MSLLSINKLYSVPASRMMNTCTPGIAVFSGKSQNNGSGASIMADSTLSRITGQQVELREDIDDGKWARDPKGAPHPISCLYTTTTCGSILYSVGRPQAVPNPLSTLLCSRIHSWRCKCNTCQGTKPAVVLASDDEASPWTRADPTTSTRTLRGWSTLSSR
jgi:hypothetical protein